MANLIFYSKLMQKNMLVNVIKSMYQENVCVRRLFDAHFYILQNKFKFVYII